jgi:hypothetical protein
MRAAAFYGLIFTKKHHPHQQKSLSKWGILLLLIKIFYKMVEFLSGPFLHFYNKTNPIDTMIKIPALSKFTVMFDLVKT